MIGGQGPDENFGRKTNTSCLHCLDFFADPRTYLDESLANLNGQKCMEIMGTCS